jgi:hypothetical protein
MTLEEIKQKNIDSLKNFELPKEVADKVIHAKPHRIVFSYHFSKVDLRTATPQRILALAAARDCAVLQLKEEALPTAPKKPASTASTDAAKDPKANSGK